MSQYRTMNMTELRLRRDYIRMELDARMRGEERGPEYADIPTLRYGLMEIEREIQRRERDE